MKTDAVPKLQKGVDTYPGFRRVALDGTIAGLVAGIVMGIWTMGSDALRGDGLWGAPQFVSTLVLGPAAYTGGHEFHLVPVATGLILHETASAVLGALYFLLVRIPFFFRFLYLTAIFSAIAAWAVYRYGILPRLAPVVSTQDPSSNLIFAYIIFALVIGAFAQARLTRYAQTPA